MLTFKNLRFSRTHKPLVEDANVTIAPKQKVGLVGPNGCGKSTLFALIRGELPSDAGHHEYPKQWQLAYVEQEISQLENTAFDYVLQGHSAYYQLHKQLEQAEQAEDWETVADIHQKIDHHRWYDLPAAAQSVMHGLGFTDRMMESTIQSMSGGWRVRLALAKSLFAPSDCLLLDEPTNHLDIKTLMWLEGYLKSYNGTLLMISHDVAILDAVTDATLAFDQQQLKLYKGNYSQYLRQRAEQLVLQQKMAEKQQQKVEHLTKFINRFKAKASKATQAQSRMKQLEKMDMIAKVQTESPFSFEFQAPDNIPSPMIRIKKGVLGYGDTVILDKVDVYLGAGDRIGLVGENGAGKSTFAKTLVGELPLIHGEYAQADGCLIGYFAQHQLEQLPKDSTPFLIFKEKNPKLSEQQVRTYLGSYDFRDDQVFQSVETLSGGEKARLILSLLAWDKPHMIILDEPTNHLDIEMRQALSLALQTYEGAVVIISHDRSFLSENVTSYYYVNQGNCTVYDSFDEIPLKEALSQSNSQKKKPALQATEAKQIQAEIQKLEKDLAGAQKQLAQVKEQLLDEKLYQENDTSVYTALLKEQEYLAEQVDSLESRWLALMQQLDS